MSDKSRSYHFAKNRKFLRCVDKAPAVLDILTLQALYFSSGRPFREMTSAAMPEKRASDKCGHRSGRFLSPQLWAEFFRGDRLACASLITAVENNPEIAASVRHRLIPHLRGAIRIGITGPPGVGKSTVTAELARRSIGADHSVGIIAVDPSSPFTGGAFLGDRIRMQAIDCGKGVFIRSLASRDGHGGLSPATPHVADIFDAFGMDRIFIETVGVGQSEMDVLTWTDLAILVLQPGTGDVIQTLKAGILEAADMFLVNKSDLSGTEILMESLRFVLDLGVRRDGKPTPPILAASAIQDTGLDRVHKELERLIVGLVQTDGYQKKKRQLMEREITDLIRQDLWERFSELAGAREEIPAAAKRFVDCGRSPYPYVRRLCSKIKIIYEKEGVRRGQRRQKTLG